MDTDPKCPFVHLTNWTFNPILAMMTYLMDCEKTALICNRATTISRSCNKIFSHLKKKSNIFWISLSRWNLKMLTKWLVLKKTGRLIDIELNLTCSSGLDKIKQAITAAAKCVFLQPSKRVGSVMIVFKLFWANLNLWIWTRCTY